MSKWVKVAGGGLLAGTAAALVMTLVMYLLRYLFGFATPAELFGDRIAPTFTANEFLGLLQKYGGYNQLKQTGAGSVLGGQLGAGMFGGLLYAIIVERDRRKAPERKWRFGISRRGWVFASTFALLFWIISLIVFWPVLEINYAGLPPARAEVATATGLLLSYASYAIALALFYRLLTGDEPLGRTATIGTPIKRRGFLLGGATAALAVAAGGLLYKLFQIATFSYDGTQYIGLDVQPITPNDKFYTVTKNVIDPRVGKSVWRLEMTGLVDRPRTYSFEELAQLPADDQETTLMCISNWVGGGLMSNAVWRGVPLKNLIEAAGPRPGTVEVMFRAVDGYTDTISIEKAMEPTTLVAFEMNGAPLPETHGYPARIISPGLFGEKSVKWVTRIELIDHDGKGFYEQQGWGPNFVIPTRARFDFPYYDQTIPMKLPVALKGIAFAGTRGISRVEVSTDGGGIWQDARLDYQSTPLTWVLWSLDWRPAEPGEYKLVVRATDGTGALQSAEDRGTAPEGATGYHRVTARIVPPE